jgi:ribosomal protein L14E/L6E/L27E
MNEFYAGQLVFSKAGHDKGQLYVIIKVEKEYVYLVDGISKTSEKPKRKNRKHIQPVNYILTDLADKLELNQKIENEEIKRAMKEYAAERKKIVRQNVQRPENGSGIGG